MDWLANPTASFFPIQYLPNLTRSLKFPGTWTIPVCDVASHDWNAPFASSGSRFGDGSLPCCCGVSCNDTKEFIKAANLEGSQTLLRGCKEQLSKSDIAFDSVDYGYGWDNSFKYQWELWSVGQKVGVVMGFVGGLFVLVSLMLCCCCR